MMSESDPKSLNCPTCGAPLEADGSNPLIRCKFCRNMIMVDALKPGEVPETASDKARGIPEAIMEAIKAGNNIEAIKFYRETYDVSLARAKFAIEQIQRGHLEHPESGFPKIIASSIEIIPKSSGRLISPKKGINLVGWIVPTIILLVLGGFLTLMFNQPGSPFVPNMIALGPASLLPIGPSGIADMVSQFYNGNTELRLIGRVDSTHGKLVWNTVGLPKDSYVDALLTDGNLVMYASQDILSAVHQADGTPAWQVRMPDKLDYGEQSMILINDRLLVMTQDRSLNAYNSSTGELIWRRALTGYDRQIRLMGAWVMIMDYPEGSTNFSLYVLDPSDGHQVHEITPVCRVGEYMEDDIDPDSGIVYDEETSALYLIFGSFNGCIQRYDLQSGQLNWQYFQENAFSFSMLGFNPILTETVLFFSDEHRLFAVDKQNGTAQILLEDPDYELVPLMLSESNLLIRARRTRGSERFELWVLNAVNGTHLWEMVLDNSSPLDPPNEISGLIDIGDYGWTWHPTINGLQLLDFQAEPNQLVIKTINLADGTSSNVIIIPFKSISGDFYSVPEIISWQENILYLSLESDLYILDTTTGKILMKFQ